MDISVNELSPKECYRLLISSIVPRPIAFVTSMDADGVLNAAPFSFFNAMGSEPPVVSLGFEPKADRGSKDTPRNIKAVGEFVVHIVDEPLAAQMNICAGSHPSDVDEIALAGIKTKPSNAVKVPYIPASPVAMECKLYQSVPLAGGGEITIGEVLHFHLRDDVVKNIDGLSVNTEISNPIARMSGADYLRASDRFSLKRPG